MRLPRGAGRNDPPEFGRSRGSHALLHGAVFGQCPTLAQTLFNSLSSQVMGLQGTSLNSTITATDNGLNRTATVSYTASSLTSFSGIIGKTTLTIGGKSTASASLPPNIDFYLLFDNSPSMAIAATTTGIKRSVANTSGRRLRLRLP